MKKMSLVFIVIMLFFSMILVGCMPKSSSENSTGDNLKNTNKTESKIFKIGITTQAWKHEFLKNLINAFRQVDEEMDNVELILIDSQDDVQRQLNDVDTLLARGVDGIILNALSFEGSSAAVSACKEAGVPVVEVVSYTENEDYLTFVGTDVKASGIMAGNMAAELIDKKGRVFEIEGIIGHTDQINRGAGIHEALKT